MVSGEPMTEEILDKLLYAINEDDLETARHLLTSNIDLNVPSPELQGAPVLYLAILKGNLALVQLLLDHGADPNFHPDQEAAEIYCPNSLSLGRQARMLFNWDQYHPIVELLEKFGAIDEDSPPQTPEELAKTEAEARRWQQSQK